MLEANVSNISTPPKPTRAVVQELRDESENREQMKFLHYARFYRDMEHDNILKLLGYCIERMPYMLIYQYWPLGDLKSYLLTNSDRGEILYQQGTLIRMATGDLRFMKINSDERRVIKIFPRYCKCIGVHESGGLRSRGFIRYGFTNGFFFFNTNCNNFGMQHGIAWLEIRLAKLSLETMVFRLINIAMIITGLT